MLPDPYPLRSPIEWAPIDLDLQMGAAAQDTEKGTTAGAPEDGVLVEIIQGTIESQQVRNGFQDLRKRNI